MHHNENSVEAIPSSASMMQLISYHSLKNRPRQLQAETKHRVHRFLSQVRRYLACLTKPQDQVPKGIVSDVCWLG